MASFKTAGDKDALSRMSVKLTAGTEKYDQIIALSQGNINESLRYHFKTNRELSKFDAKISQPFFGSLKGQLQPPTIELVDIDGADQGIYIIEFGPNSTFTTTTLALDPDTNGPTMVTTKADASGWKIAFYVDFSLKAMTRVDEHVKDDIAKLINNPGVYTVEQLLIDFGTADLMTFNWERSRVTGLNTTVSQVIIKQFVHQWLAVARGGSDVPRHQVIGYAVKTNNPQAASPLAPSLPPTSVRLQTIAYRDEKTQPSSNHAYNAFLFTEMTENRKMITKDLDWSGNFFYDSIGGTLIMSKELFMDRYLATKLEFLNRSSLRVRVDILVNLIDQYFGPTISKPAVFGLIMYDNNNVSIEWKRASTDCELEWRSDRNYELPDMKCRLTSYNRLRVMPGSGIFLLEQHLEVIFEDPNGLFLPQITVRLENKIKFTLSSVPTTGQLDIDLESQKPDIMVDYKYLAANYTDDTKELFKQFDSRKPSFLLIVVRLLHGTDALTDEIKATLNGQARFVFPGGGTFEMKDPMFNNAGDLMIGLTYRSGE